MRPEKIPCSGKPGASKCLILLLTILLIVSAWAVPSLASECDTCIPCHGNLESIHGDFNHDAAPGSGPVAIFADRTHDDAAWAYGQPGPHFDIMVDCTLCHNTDLPKVHGNDCATCHPTPYDSLGTWNKGCQQGGCHTFIHEDIVDSHDPFESAWNDSDNDCNVCHIPSTWAVPQTNCLNCHSAYSAGDVSPPVTTDNVQAEYIGAALIDFSIKESGKVGVGRTFYQLNGGSPVAAGKNLLITTPGHYELQYWSIDQSGNTEAAHNTVIFDILKDTTPPTTISNAQGSYTKGTVITLTASDVSTQGVKNTYYSINDGATRLGTTVSIPGTVGTTNYKLTFWSEDWSGNVEGQNIVYFTVTIPANGTIKLVWWDADVNPNHSPVGGEWMKWTIKRGTTIVSRGTRNGPWSGVDNITVPISTTPYTIYLSYSWWEEEDFLEEDASTFYNQSMSNPGQVMTFHY